MLMPAAGAVLHSGVWLDASAFSYGGIARVEFLLNGATVTNKVVATAAPTFFGYVAGFDSTSVPNGAYTLQSKATDTAGFTALSPAVNITVHNQPLSTAVLLPAAGAVVHGNVLLNASATGTSAVTQVRFVLTGCGLKKSVIAAATPTAYGWLAGFASTSVGNCTYTLQSVATETGGTSTTSAAVKVTVSN